MGFRAAAPPLESLKFPLAGPPGKKKEEGGWERPLGGVEMWDFPVYSVAPPALHLGVENARGSLPSLGSGPPTRAHYSGHRSREAAWYL